MISQSVSESNISMVVARSTMEKGANALELALLGQGGSGTSTPERRSAVRCGRRRVRSIKGIAASAFGAVAAKGINVRMIASGSSNQNLSLRGGEGREGDRQGVHSAFLSTG